MAFPSDHRARRRLLRAVPVDVLDRFRPTPPSAPHPLHYVLGPAGAAVLAADHGLDPTALRLPPRPRHRHRPQPAPRPHPRRQHLVRHTSSTTRRVRSSRRLTSRPSGGAADGWWSEARCARHFGDLVRPDAYGRLTTAPGADHAGSGGGTGDGGRGCSSGSSSYDFGTSTLTRWPRKLDRYAASPPPPRSPPRC